MKKTVLLLFPVLVCCLAACSTIDPSGIITTETHLVTSDYIQITIHSAIEFQIVRGDTDQVIIETDDNVQQYVYVKNSNDNLEIGIKPMIGSYSFNVIKATIVTTQSLYGIELDGATSGSVRFPLTGVNNQLKLKTNGASKLETEIDMPGGNAWLELDGASDMRLNGTLKNCTLLMDGASDLKAFGLSVQNLVAQSMSGASDAEITVSDKMYIVEGEGASSLHYKGHPTIDPQSHYDITFELTDSN